MDTINLKTGYLVAAFPDFESAFAATNVFSGNGFKVAYLNEVSYIQDCEVERYVLKYGQQQRCYYHNYLKPTDRRRKPKAVTSLKTALYVLEKRNKLQAKFIVIVAPKHRKARGEHSNRY
jgi:hypothetical protein